MNTFIKNPRNYFKSQILVNFKSKLETISIIFIKSRTYKEKI